MSDPTVVSLFSGVGGLDRGLARAGFRHLLLCESDPYRRDVLRARFPGVPIADDVRRVADGEPAWGADVVTDRTVAVGGGRKAGAGLPGGVALVAGGSPCQDLSVAGQRRGLTEGSRSNLFFEMARVIDAVRPRWVLWENVPGAFSSQGGRDFGAVLGTLADLGYGLGWRVLDSRFFGVPQRRRRVFVVGAVVDGDPRAAADRAGEVLAVGSRCGWHPATRGEAGPDVAVASLSGLGNGGPDDNDGQGGRLIASTAFHQTQEPIHGEEFTPAIGKTSIGMGISNASGVRRLTPTECERLQGLPDGWTDLGGTPDSRRYSALGDAVTATVAEWIGRRILDAS